MTGILKKKNWYRLVKARLRTCHLPVKVELQSPTIGGYQTLRKYSYLSWLDKFIPILIYTRRTRQLEIQTDTQPEVTIDNASPIYEYSAWTADTAFCKAMLFIVA